MKTKNREASRWIKLCLLFITATLSGTLSAQNAHSLCIVAKGYDSAYSLVQEMPRFNGDVNRYLADHLIYPEVEKEAGISGTVYLSFIIEKDSSITYIKIVKGVPGGPGLDKEAITVISHMPKWIPGRQDGKLERVVYNMPIQFELK